MSPELIPAKVAVPGGRALNGSVRTPGDKSISHRALMLAAMAQGRSTVSGLSAGDDVAATRRAVEAMGATVEDLGDGEVAVTGGALHAPAEPMDCGNSGTGLRLLMGVAAGLEGTTVLTGDASLSQRPMGRIAEPLVQMGASVEGRQATVMPPVTVRGGGLHAITYEPPMASAQVKSAILLAGLVAVGETVVHEPVATRRHTEEMLAQAGADVDIIEDGKSLTIKLRASRLRPMSWEVPGDPSQAAFWAVGGVVAQSSAVAVRGIYGGPGRLGFVDVLRRMGAQVEVIELGNGAVDLTARSSELHGTVVHADEVPSVDEVPILTVAACAAAGPTTFQDMGELRVKESDRFAACVDLAVALGAEVTVDGDSFTVQGLGSAKHFRAFSADAHGDHRLAMAAAVAASAGQGGEIAGFGLVGSSYPGFLADLRTLAGGPVASLDPTIIAIDGPAGAGKSSVSRAVAAQLGLQRLDTGSMYRAVAAAVLDAGASPEDHEILVGLAASLEVDHGGRVHVGGHDVTDRTRDADVSEAVSLVARVAEVRNLMVEAQRRWLSERGGGVVEGRDIGSTVFPDATLKVYLTASEEARASRRQDEDAANVSRRDRIDSSRTVSPLQVPEGAVVIDTTDMSLEQAIEAVLGELR